MGLSILFFLRYCFVTIAGGVVGGVVGVVVPVVGTMILSESSGRLGVNEAGVWPSPKQDR